jgi:S-DNA-T family DNA segregation ATPase FtsK/SpoIIIE
MKAEIEQLLGLILSQGRAVGVVVIACVQDPSKEVLSLRQLFPVRVGLRLSEASQVGMVLGPGARERGALCDQISDRLPGVGYVAEDGQTELKRVRAFYVDDAAIAALSDRYRRPVDDNGEDLPAGTAF